MLLERMKKKYEINGSLKVEPRAGQKRDDIQLLRAFSITSVLIFHFNPRWLPFGYLGVDM